MMFYKWKENNPREKAGGPKMKKCTMVYVGKPT